MADVDKVCAALAKLLTDVTGLRAVDYIPETISPPAAFVNVTRLAPDTFGDGSFEVTLDLVVIVARSRSGQDQLQEYMSTTGPKSVWNAVRENKDLDLGVDATVTQYRSLGVEEIAAFGFAGGAFETVVLA